MAKRRLTLTREPLIELESDDLSAVVGAISVPHPLCLLTSIQHSMCHTCGIACTYDCGETS